MGTAVMDLAIFACENSDITLPAETSTGAERSTIKIKSVEISAIIHGHLGNALRLYYEEPKVDILPERLLTLARRFEASFLNHGRSISDDFRDDLMKSIPALRSFAFSLTGNISLSEDLVQETLMKAWSNRCRFEPGSNLPAWLFTIMRNNFYTDIRKRKREVEDADGVHAAKLTELPEQEDVVALQRLYTAMETLPAAQREALLLVGAEGLTYEEAAQRQGCEVGTVKSRVSRARSQLSSLFSSKTGKLVTAAL
jgi:RNA polymerase sigma-70 factor (ECF subfamily)